MVLPGVLRCALAPSARHRVAVADGRFGAARPGRGDAFESPTQSAQALCFSPPRIQKQKGHPEGGLLLLYPWRREGDSNCSLKISLPYWVFCEFYTTTWSVFV